MRKYKLCIVAVVLIMVCSCATLKPPTFLESDYENAPVKSIGILELNGKSILNDERGISEKDFNKVENIILNEVFKRNYLTTRVKYESFSIDSEKDLTREVIFEICEKQNVEAVLFSSISEYSDVFLGKHTLIMNFKLFKANGDSIWADKVNLKKNGLVTFLGGVAVTMIVVAAQPDDGITPKSTKTAFGLGIGALAGLLAEGLTSYIPDAISDRFKTLPKGSR